MRHLFTRMAARALGVAPVAQPLIPALFTPQMGKETSEAPPETFVEKVASPGESARSTVRINETTLPQEWEVLPVPKPRSSSPEFSPGIEHRNPHADQEPLPAPASTISEPAPRSLPVPSELAEPAHERHAYLSAPVLEAGAITLPESNATTIQDRYQHQPFRTPNPRHTLLHISRVTPALPIHDGSKERAAPVIRVTIGRIDVRAQFPAAQSAAPVRHPRPPALSLDEYLKQRREGKR